ncbi:hypothetical protein STEG23_023752 [Scotinomys teguina]
MLLLKNSESWTLLLDQQMKVLVSCNLYLMAFEIYFKITEMAKESMLSPTTESIYPALVNCAASVDIILPQITSNMWARGLGQLIRAKNLKTIGDLSTLTASEIKTLPIHSPKVFNVKKALRVYHEQQRKCCGLEEIPVFDISEKAVNGVESKPLSADEERLASDLIDPVTTDTSLSKNLMAQINALALQLDSEDLYSYSGSQLLEMHEKLEVFWQYVYMCTMYITGAHDGQKKASDP